MGTVVIIFAKPKLQQKKVNWKRKLKVIAMHTVNAVLWGPLSRKRLIIQLAALAVLFVVLRLAGFTK